MGKTLKRLLSVLKCSRLDFLGKKVRVVIVSQWSFDAVKVAEKSYRPRIEPASRRHFLVTPPGVKNSTDGVRVSQFKKGLLKDTNNIRTFLVGGGQTLIGRRSFDHFLSTSSLSQAFTSATENELTLT